MHQLDLPDATHTCLIPILSTWKQINKNSIELKTYTE